MNLDAKTGFSSKVTKLVTRVPIWGWTIILMLASAVANVFTAQTVLNTMAYLMPINAGTFILMIAIYGILCGIVIRLFARLIYAVGTRLYFRLTGYVPDYNLRRLPISYNVYLGVVMAFLSVASLLIGVINALIYALPIAYYAWSFLRKIILLVALCFIWLTLQGFVDDWQMKRVYLALGIPTGILYAVLMFGGM